MNRDPNTPQGPLDVRTYLAAERTLLAWIRTGLALMGFGFVVARFGLFLRELAALHDIPAQPRYGASLWVGTCLVLLGVAVNLGAALRHWQSLRRLARGEDISMGPLSLATSVAVLLAFLGLLIALSLIVGMREAN